MSLFIFSRICVIYSLTNCYYSSILLIRLCDTLVILFRIGIDEWLRVPSVEDVFALGDCAGFLEQTGKQVLPALAQVIIVLGHCIANRCAFSSKSTILSAILL